MATHTDPDRAPARPRHETLIDAAIAVAVFAASIGMLLVDGPGDDAGEVTVVGVLLTALTSLPLVVVRRNPLAVFVLTALASALLRGLENPVGPPLGPTVALFWVAALSDESRTRTRLTLAIVLVVFAAHVLAAGTGSDTLVALLFGVLVWGGAWLAGDRARLRAERMAELEQRALRAEREAERERRLAAAEERTRIARDLHDSAGHAINVILVHAGLGRLRTEDDPEARAAFETIEEVARETVGEIDQLVGVLREDGSSAESGDGVEPPPGLAAVDALLARHRDAGLEVTATVRGAGRPLSPGVERGAYRILQEALTNAARHGAGSAEVELTVGATALDLSVANPLGHDRDGGVPGGGHGLVGMRERAAMLGGSLQAGARDGRFEVHASLPLVHDPA